MLMTLIAFVVALGLLIAVHEWGHYRMAVVRGVRVELSMRPPDAADPRRSPAAGGGVLLDLGYYGLRILLLLARSAGGPPRITDAVLRHGAGPAGSGAPGADIEARVRAVYPSGARGRVDASMDAASSSHLLSAPMAAAHAVAVLVTVALLAALAGGLSWLAARLAPATRRVLGTRPPRTLRRPATTPPVRTAVRLTAGGTRAPPVFV